MSCPSKCFYSTVYLEVRVYVRMRVYVRVCVYVRVHVRVCASVRHMQMIFLLPSVDRTP